MTGPAPAADDRRPLLAADELRRLCDFLYQHTGMSYGEAKRYYIERRVAERMAHAGTTSFAAYMTTLRTGEETEALINSFTVNETYFYRETNQFACLCENLLPEVVARRGPGDRVRIWSVPCSTGDEAYSIAIWLLENWRLVDAYHVEIVGSDLDTRVVREATAGFYGARALNRLPAPLRDGYFEPQADASYYRIIQDLRESVTFTSANLVDAASMAAQGRFDVIFCRNVLIYFDDASRAAATANLFAALVPGGFLCLGHSESITRIPSPFLARRFPSAVVYQRPLEGQA